MCILKRIKGDNSSKRVDGVVVLVCLHIDR